MALTYEKTREMFRQAQRVMPYGVSSNFRYWGPDQTPVIARGKGGHVWDLDGNEYIDYRLGFGPVILGHADERVDQRVVQALGDGLIFAHTHPLEVRVAERIIRLCPGVEKVRFANSGTEATLHAIRIARAYTGRDVVVKFEGQYHGFQDYTLWTTAGAPRHAVGSRRSPIPVPNGSGIPGTIRDLIITLPFNDFELLERTVRARWGAIATIIVEPVLGNSASVLPAPGWLQHIRALCDEYGILMLMDEVKTGFRLAKGGAAEYFGVTGDLATYAKALGNGYPVAAIGGSDEVMSSVAPGEIGIGGTYCGNRVGTAAAEATLEILETTPALDRIAAYGGRLIQGLSDILTEAGLEHARLGPACMPSFVLGTSEVPQDWRGVLDTDLDAYDRLGELMYALGVEYESDPREPWFVCAAHDDQDLAATLERFNDAVKALKAEL